MSAPDSVTVDILLGALSVLTSTTPEDFRAALDVLGSPHDDDGLDPLARERVWIAFQLLRAAPDDDVEFWALALARSVPR